MIPKSINWSRWTFFQKELGVFLTGEKPRMGGVIPDITGGAGLADGGGQNGQKMHNYGNLWKSRFFENLGVNLGKTVIQGDSTVNKSVISGKPTHAFNFKLTSETLALRIFKPEGGKCCVSWLKPINRGLGASFVLNNSPKPNTSVGPNFGHGFGKEIILASKDPKGKGPLVSLSLGVSSENQEFGSRERITGESSRDAGRVSVVAPSVLTAETCAEMRRNASEKLPDSNKDNFSSVDPSIKSSHKADTHAVRNPVVPNGDG